MEKVKNGYALMAACMITFIESNFFAGAAAAVGMFALIQLMVWSITGGWVEW